LQARSISKPAIQSSKQNAEKRRKKNYMQVNQMREETKKAKSPKFDSPFF